MTTTVFLAVLLAAALHAVWNALVKSGGDAHGAMAGVVVGHVPVALVAVLLSPLPAAAALPWLLAGIALHVLYQLCLLGAYRVGDLTQVYPIARGSAPMIVAAVSVGAFGAVLAPLELAAILVIGTGILSLAIVRRADGLRNRRAGLLALATGTMIAGYSLSDGMGARVAGTALGFYGWLALGNTLAFVALTAVLRPDLRPRLLRPGWRGTAGGTASFAAYALVVWAFTQAPIALVTALRETSIVFALLIGVFALGEKLDLGKVAATMATLLGAVMLRIARP